MLYKEVAHAVILYGIEIWVVTGAMLKVLEGLQNQVSRRMTGMMAQRAEDGDRD